jgi:Rieske Fe-S protein
MTELHDQPGTATRRGVLFGAGALGAGAILAACGGEEPSSSGNNPPADDDPPDTEETEEPPAASESIKKSDVPVGGGIIVKEQETVVTQPTAGQFQAFSAICTHQMCVLANVTNKMINCTCHGSQYNIADGSVARGPAMRPLTRKNVTDNGDTLTVT